MITRTTREIMTHIAPVAGTIVAAAIFLLFHFTMMNFNYKSAVEEISRTPLYENSYSVLNDVPTCESKKWVVKVEDIQEESLRTWSTSNEEEWKATHAPDKISSECDRLPVHKSEEWVPSQTGTGAMECKATVWYMPKGFANKKQSYSIWAFQNQFPDATPFFESCSKITN